MSKSETVFGRSTEKASGDCESRRSFLKKACAATITIAGSVSQGSRDTLNRYD